MPPAGRGDPFREWIQQNRVAYNRLQQELKEINLLLQQTSTEIEKLSQRHAQATQRLRQMEPNLESHPREDLRTAYTAVHETQLHLLTMTNQLEQLESKRESLAAQIDLLQRSLEMVESAQRELGRAASAPPPLSEGTVVRIIEAQESERQRLARQMHDGPAQSLTNLILQAEVCERFFDSDPSRAREELANLKEAVNLTFQKTRRFIFDLRPMMLDDLGLTPTMRRYVQDYQEKSGLTVDLSFLGEERRLAPYTEVTIFRALQELLNNVDRHAQASHVKVTLNLESEPVRLSVEDDGQGFEVEPMLGAVAERKSLGLATLRERLEMLGGHVQVQSQPGQGTVVTLEVPAGIPPTEPASR